VFGVHAAPIIAVYGVNDMAPWGHMYVNPGLTEPKKYHARLDANRGWPFHDSSVVRFKSAVFVWP
ncbi:MAG: hypothetical protein KH350_05605, partial [Collinsella sp.]|nr:hypothetical protein [Collinsella sp.]